MMRSTAELRQYLVGEWLFENDFKDTSGNNNDGTPTDIEWKPTLRGMKPKFNGSSSFIDCGNDSSLNITDKITISVWINPQLPVGNYKTILGKIKTGNTELYEIRTGTFTSSSINIQFRASNGTERKVETSVNVNEWVHIVGTYDGEYLKIYKNGSYITQTASTDGIASMLTTNLYLGCQTPILNLYKGDSNGASSYNIDMSTTEVLNLYNETSFEHGVIEAERSYQHDLDNVIDASDAVGAWGTAKESTTELVDLSGNGNIADIHGAMPTEGFILGRRFNGDGNYLDCDNKSDYNFGSSQDFSIISLIQTNVSADGIIMSRVGVDPRWYLRVDGAGLSGRVRAIIDDGPTSITNILSTSSVNDGCIHLVGVAFDRDCNAQIYVDGVADGAPVSISSIGNVDNNNSLLIGKLIGGNFFEDTILFSMLYGRLNGASYNSSLFNTLARLPLWSVNYTDYTDNVTEYTDNLPYSSSIINSGTFKVDDDKLQCVSAGTMTYSASYDFDGSEYIKVEIDGVEYAGTGTITHGNTTVSVAQGSNKITIVMGTGDTIEGEVKIQFRKEV